MALIAPARRDTRPHVLRSADSFGRRPPPIRDAHNGFAGALAPATFDSDLNRLGLTWEATVGAVAAIGVFLWFHSADLTKPAALARALDPAPLRTFFAMGGEGLRCQMQGYGRLAGLGTKPVDCDTTMDKLLSAHKGESNILGIMANGPSQENVTGSGWNGTFSNVPTPDAKLAEVKRAGCFQTDRYSVGDRGLHKVTEVPQAGDTISLARYLSLNADAAQRVSNAAPAARDGAILKYFESRKLLGSVIHRFFGDAGLEVEARANAAPEHQAAVTLLRERLADPGFAPSLSALERAELELLARTPLDFISCIARRGQAGKTG
jgi:hypothetical protein